MDQPLISVIISAYNCEKLVGEAIKSILNQSYSNFEIVIADDGSQDNTRFVIDSFSDKRIKSNHNDSNIGLLHTWNKLIPLTKGYYLTWQDADDISYPERLEILLKTLEANPKAVVCGSNFKRPFPSWKDEVISHFPISNDQIKSYIKNNKDLPFCGLRNLFTREVVLEFGGLRAFYHKLGCEDFDLLLRISEKYEMINTPAVLYEYRYYSSSASKINLAQLDYRKVYIQEIVFFLHDQRMKYGEDALMNEQYLPEFNAFLEMKKLELEKDPTIVIKRIVKNKTANKDYKGALGILKNQKSKLSKNEYFNLYYLILKRYTKSVLKLFLRAK